MNECRLLLVALMAVGAIGCNRVAPKAVKAVGFLDDAAKAAPVAGQGASKASPTVGERVTKWADRADTAIDAYDRYQQISASPSPATRPRERFPYSASTVRPISNQRVILTQDGSYAVLNNYRGYSFFDAYGGPLGFSAWNSIEQEERYFDPSGWSF